MIECLCEKDIKTAEDLCEEVQNCKRDLKGLKVGKHHKLMGAGGKTIMLVGKSDKEFISYSEVMNQKGHFGKLLHKLFFEEDDSEESDVSVEDVFLDIQEKLTIGQIAELSDMIAKINTRRFDFSRMFFKSEDFTSEIDSAKKWYVEIGNEDIIRAFGTMEALDIPFDSSKSKWKVKAYGHRVTLMIQDKIGIQFLTKEEVTDSLKIKEISDKWILCRNDYGDSLFHKYSDGRFEMVVVTDNPRAVSECRWL